MDFPHSVLLAGNYGPSLKNRMAHRQTLCLLVGLITKHTTV